MAPASASGGMLRRHQQPWPKNHKQSKLPEPEVLKHTREFHSPHLVFLCSSSMTAVFTSEYGSTNWLSGFDIGNAGTAYHFPPLAAYTSPLGNFYPSAWLLSTDQQWTYRSQGVDRTTVARGEPSSAAVRLCINCAGIQESDWAVGAVLVYAGELSALQMQQVEDYLSVLYGVPLERAQAGEHICTRVLRGVCACTHAWRG